MPAIHTFAARKDSALLACLLGSHSAQQSGVFAGKGGFDIRVSASTTLTGAVIASDAPAALNRLETASRSRQPKRADAPLTVSPEQKQQLDIGC